MHFINEYLNSIVMKKQNKTYVHNLLSCFDLVCLHCALYFPLHTVYYCFLVNFTFHSLLKQVSVFCFVVCVKKIV